MIRYGGSQVGDSVCDQVTSMPALGNEMLKHYKLSAPIIKTIMGFATVGYVCSAPPKGRKVGNVA